MVRARGRGRGLTRGRSLSQPGRGVRAGVGGPSRTPIRDRRRTGLVKLQVDMINQQAAHQNETDDQMVIDPPPLSVNNSSSDIEWDWEDDHSSQRVEQSQDMEDIGGTEQPTNEEQNGNEGEQRVYLIDYFQKFQLLEMWRKKMLMAGA